MRVKKSTILFSGVLFLCGGCFWASAEEYSGIPVDAEHFPDSIFRTYVASNFDVNGDGILDLRESANVEIMEGDGIACAGISSLKGIACFTNLKYLDCSENQISYLDLSGNPALESLICTGNGIENLLLSENSGLRELHCGANYLAGLNLENMVHLETLCCWDNVFTTLDLSGTPMLKYLECGGNQLSSLDLSKTPFLETVMCEGNRLTSLTVGDLPELQGLVCFENYLSALDVSGAPGLKWLYCQENLLRSLELGGNSQMTDLCCDGNRIVSLDLENVPLSGEYQDVRTGNQSRYVRLRQADDYDLWELGLAELVGTENIGRVKAVKGEVIREDGRVFFSPGRIPEQFVYQYDTQCAAASVQMEVTLYLEAECSVHRYVSVVEKEATCGHSGYAYEECVFCSKRKSGSEHEMPKLETHTFGEWQVIKEASVIEEGQKIRVCSVCGTKEEEVMPRLNSDVPESEPSSENEKQTESESRTEQTSQPESEVQWEQIPQPESEVRGEQIPQPESEVQGEQTSQSESEAQTGQISPPESGGDPQPESQKKTYASKPVFNAKWIPLQKGKSTTALKVSGIAKGDRIVSWKSGNAKIACVNKKGKITARKTGKTVIQAVLKSGRKALVKVVVQLGPVKVKKIVGLPKKIRLSRGKKTVFYVSLEPITAKGNIKWKSSDMKVASITSKGHLTAKRKGTAVITVSCGQCAAKCKVTVK